MSFLQVTYLRRLLANESVAAYLENERFEFMNLEHIQGIRSFQPSITLRLRVKSSFHLAGDLLTLRLLVLAWSSRYF